MSVGTGAAVQSVGWVQCERCSKWRTLQAGKLEWEGEFACEMNTWQRTLASCDMLEEYSATTSSTGQSGESNPSIALFAEEKSDETRPPPSGQSQLARLVALVEANCTHDRCFPLGVLEGNSAGGRVFTDAAGTAAALGSLCGFWAVVGEPTARNVEAVVQLLTRERGWWSCVYSFPNETWSPALAAGLGRLAAAVPRNVYHKQARLGPGDAPSAPVSIPKLTERPRGGGGLHVRLLSDDPGLFARYQKVSPRLGELAAASPPPPSDCGTCRQKRTRLAMHC